MKTILACEGDTSKIDETKGRLRNKNKNCKLLVKAFKYRLKFRKNITGLERPRAPHNTTSYIINSHFKDRNKVVSIKSSDVNFEVGKHYSIENFMITGGSMKGIIHHLIKL